MQENFGKISMLPFVLSEKGTFENLIISLYDKVTKLTWHQMIEIKIPRYTFCRNRCSYQLPKVSYWFLKNYTHCAIKYFWRQGHLPWPGDLPLNGLWLKFSRMVQKECIKRCQKNDGAACRRFSAVCEQNTDYVFKMTPTWANVNWRLICKLEFHHIVHFSH